MNLTNILRAAVLSIAPVALSPAARADVPPDIAKALVAVGRGVCVNETAQLYRPLHANPPYPGISISRDLSFGPDPKNVVDVYSAEKGGGSRPVLLFLPGGAGNRSLPGANGDVFYGNIMVWAVKNGMTGVIMQRRPGDAWDDPAKDVAKAVQWVGDNIAKYNGDPSRVFLWAQSAGNVPTGNYVGHPEFYGPKGVGLKGVVFMSGASFNILPATSTQTGPNPQCNPVPGSAPAQAGGRGNAPPAQAPPPQVDQATLLARSNLPGLTKSKLPFLVSVAELDPPSIIAFSETLRDELCKAGRCPAYMVFKNHSHISEVMSPNTADDTVTGPILKWMKTVK